MTFFKFYLWTAFVAITVVIFCATVERDNRHETMEKALRAGSAEYDSHTGDFEFINSTLNNVFSERFNF